MLPLRRLVLILGFYLVTLLLNMSLIPWIIQNWYAWTTNRKDFIVDDRLNDWWTFRSYASWAITWWNIVTYANDGRVWLDKNLTATPLKVGSYVKARYLADTDTWGHNCTISFWTDTNTPKCSFSIYAVTYSGHPPSMYWVNSSWGSAWDSTGISAWVWYVLKVTITATWYLFQIYDTTETTVINSYAMTDTLYSYVQVSLWQWTWNPTYVDWIELKY